MKKKNIKKSRAHRNMIKMITVLSVFACAVIAVIVIAKNPVNTNAAENDQMTKYYKSVVIQNGDTLWSIADRYMEPSKYRDQREYITELMSINNLKSEKITYGEHLIVAYYDHE